MLFKLPFALSVVALACFCGVAAAQAIYTCTDDKGRKITSDRPIMECLNRNQQELTPTGRVKRVVVPTPTAQELILQEERDKAEAEARARQAEEKRRDRALLLRYPSKAVHDKERVEALAQIDEVIKASTKRTIELAAQRKAIELEFEFYQADPGKAPPALKRQREENETSVGVQKRFIAEQDLEKKRVNLRFDEELVKLKQLWALAARPPASAASAAPSAPKK